MFGNLVDFQNKVDFICEFLTFIVYDEIQLSKWQLFNLKLYLMIDNIYSIYNYCQKLSRKVGFNEKI